MQIMSLATSVISTAERRQRVAVEPHDVDIIELVSTEPTIEANSVIVGAEDPPFQPCTPAVDCEFSEMPEQLLTHPAATVVRADVQVFQMDPPTSERSAVGRVMNRGTYTFTVHDCYDRFDDRVWPKKRRSKITRLGGYVSRGVVRPVQFNDKSVQGLNIVRFGGTNGQLPGSNARQSICHTSIMTDEH